MKDCLHAIMLNALIKGDISELTRTAYEYLKLPVMITDSEYICLAHFPNELLGDPLWDAIHESGRTPLEYIRKFNDEKMMEIIIRQDVPYFLNWGFLADRPRILGNILIDGVVVGVITVLSKDCTEELLKQIDLIRSVIAVEFQRRKITSGNSSGAWPMFLTSLIEGKIDSEAQLKQWLKHLDRKIRGDHCIIAAKPFKGGDENSLLHLIKKDIEQIDFELYPVVYSSCIFFLLTGLSSHEDYQERIGKMILKLASMELNFGISNMFTEIMQIKIFREQASFALSVCLDTSDVNNLYFSDCALKLMFKTLADNLPLQSCIHPAIDILETYDLKNGTDYLQTLSVYIRLMCGAAETVRTLHIHRNTLPYRLEVIGKICGIDLDDKSTCAYLLCSFYIRELI